MSIPTSEPQPARPIENFGWSSSSASTSSYGLRPAVESRMRQLEKQQLKELRAQRKLEETERKRKKEEKQQKKVVKQQRLQRLDKELFPELIGTNNARVSRLNLKAFSKFCYQSRNEDRETPAGAVADIDGNQKLAKSEQIHLSTILDNDFETYEEWMNYIRNKNLGLEQQPTVALTARRISKARPLFWERPLRGWIVDHSAIMESCDRTQHTSAHCLEYLSQDHLYLIPLREARNYPNRIHAASEQNSTKTQYADLDTYGGQKSTENTEPVRRVSSSTTNSAKMHFHIFWRGIVTDKLSLTVQALLFTQPLDRALLHIWIDSTDLPSGEPENYEQNVFSKDLITAPLNRFIKLHVWDQKAQETYAYPLAQELNQLPQSSTEVISEKSKVPPVALSDQARFLILYRYGGMYLDADVLLLRDMSPLYDAGMEFAYEWSSTQMYNTAVLRLNRGSSVARRILDGAKTKEKETVDHRQESQIPTELKNGWEATQQANILKKRTRGKPKQQQPAHNNQPLEVAHADSMDIDKQNKDSVRDIGGDPALTHFESPSFSYAATTPHYLSKRGNTHEMRPKEIYHPARLRNYLDPQNGSLTNNGLVMMPTAMFDPLWLRVDSVESQNGLLNDREKMMEGLLAFPDAFTNASAICPAHHQQQQQGKEEEEGLSRVFMAGPEVFFTGAYAYHWHNNWKTPIAADSWMGLMRQAYDEFLRGERPNLYGEWFPGNRDDVFRK
ncbi:hypothetical protein BC939DRAFT_504393 [Gamsiella multidivaricata]|uniref:uncharacterized protein n=1 Tax=Gamsiella multidivaricata TaxID=101098 RepID=UPI0022204005|nr:uncharacterized protein BC939DRAFT_504393 [Gamsiella multidivaricata]KAG0368519.1 hypothetical protein BGZ54_001781 [Gamsiella multidivaricata]KAI7821329.1 hypothetical protein BC939DRAFT_504393 [Gamsiella multidivaricata]